MDSAAIRGNVRTVVGLVGVALVLAAVVSLTPRGGPAAAGSWQPPAGHVLADTVELGDDRALRLWTKPGAWYVERLIDGQHEEIIGASVGGDRYTVTEVFEAYVGTVPRAEAQAVSVRSPGGAAVRAEVNDGVFIVGGRVADAGENRLLVTTLDAAGVRVGGETEVPIAGRPVR
ncbi:MULTISPECIES: hypothetical protein [unclassified Solwaraspora]|uniref:hypothetical protein n=1 Tax=unclassified Solwaraspora TaxID=2627926 RepID=UPI00259B4AD4|nr:hypothetical protein [Solwaraspora sp. WMMA2056]WJK39457.1 hypothetical protein O7608_23790 [Solwaraspora sp. WMMA2056]